MHSVQPIFRHQLIGEKAIPYLDYGGNGPPLVLLHATGFLPWLWHPIACCLSADYRVIAPYFGAHRDADPRAGGLGWFDLAQDFKLFCEALSLAKPFLIGHSMGATIGVLTHTAHHMQVTKMVLIEPIFLPQEFYRIPITLEQHPLAAKAIKRRNTWSSRAEADEYFKSKSFFQSWDNEVLSLYIAHGITESAAGGFELTCSPRKEAAMFMGSRQLNPWPLLGTVACPTLVLEGEASENRHWIDLKEIAGRIPAGEYVGVPEAGHLVPMEKPQQVTDIVINFLM